MIRTERAVHAIAMADCCNHSIHIVGQQHLRNNDSTSAETRASTTPIPPRASSPTDTKHRRIIEALTSASEQSELSTLLRQVNIEEETRNEEVGTCRQIRYNVPRKLSEMLRQRSIIVDILAMLFGIGTWVGINATFIQLPLLVEKAPEGWSLPSYLSVMVQIGNVGPLVYTVVQRFVRGKRTDAYIIYTLLALATTSALCTAFLYDRTAMLFGSEHSVALFVLTCVTAINACTSSVLFMPYMGRFQEKYLVTYFVGEGLSGLLPSVVALIQGVGGSAECILAGTNSTTGEPIYEQFTPPPLFGTTEFFIFIFTLMVCSCVGFSLLDNLKVAKRQYAAVTVSNGNSYEYKRDVNDATATSKHDESATVPDSDLTPLVSPMQYWSLLVLIGAVSFFANGMFNSIQSYSCLPYGSNAYHLAATLSVIANPVACFLAIFLPHTSLRAIVGLTSVAGLLTVYVFVTAALSPTPPLYDSPAGAAIVITTWTLLIGFISYIKLAITAVMRAQGGKSLVYTGALTQLGSLIGSALIFVLINYTNSFGASYDNETC